MTKRKKEGEEEGKKGKSGKVALLADFTSSRSTPPCLPPSLLLPLCPPGEKTASLFPRPSLPPSPLAPRVLHRHSPKCEKCPPPQMSELPLFIFRSPTASGLSSPLLSSPPSSSERVRVAFACASHITISIAKLHESTSCFIRNDPLPPSLVCPLPRS